jgi:anti-anti-sigma regulatory factor
MARAVTGRKKQPVRWALPADFGIETLAATAAALPVRSAAADLSIEAAAVQRVHAASLQWLLAVSRSSRAAGHAFRLRQPSPVLEEAVRRLGLAAELMISPEEDCV